MPTASRTKRPTVVMRRIDLREYGTSEPLRLCVGERDALRATVPSLTIEPAPGEASAYCLKPGSTIGALEIGDLSVAMSTPSWTSRACSSWRPTCWYEFKLREERFDLQEEHHAGRGAGARTGGGRAAGVRKLTAARVPDGGGGAVHGPRADTRRGADQAPVRLIRAD